LIDRLFEARHGAPYRRFLMMIDHTLQATMVIAQACLRNMKIDSADVPELLTNINQVLKASMEQNDDKLVNYRRRPVRSTLLKRKDGKLVEDNRPLHRKPDE
jgi:hypothetical protein